MEANRSKVPCLLCGGETGEYVGLCEHCCMVIKVKTDAFARASKRRIEELEKAEEQRKREERNRNWGYSVEAFFGPDNPL